MGNHRMFSNTLTDSDSFLEMPLSTQALYFHLGMKTDDEGFVGNPKKTIRSVNCTEDDFQPLVTKGYVICFESGVVVITHWHIHNKIRKDRFKDTIYQDEKKHLTLSESGVYSLKAEYVNQVSTSCQPSVNQTETQGKQNNQSKKEKEDNFSTLITCGRHKNVLLSSSLYHKIKETIPPDSFQKVIDRLSDRLKDDPNISKDRQLELLYNWAKMESLNSE